MSSVEPIKPPIDTTVSSSKLISSPSKYSPWSVFIEIIFGGLLLYFRSNIIV